MPEEIRLFGMTEEEIDEEWFAESKRDGGWVIHENLFKQIDNK